MDAGIYLRLSEEKDSEEGTDAAYERFEQRCRELCARRGWNVREVYREPIVSAYAGKPRAVFRRALRDLENGHIKALVAIKWARLSRNRRDTAALFDLVTDHDVIVATADGQDTTTRAGRLSLEIQAMLAREESEETSERVKLQQRQAALKGRPPTGRRLFGYSKGRTEIVPEEAEVIRELVRRVLLGESVRSLATYANTVSTTTTGRSWSQRTLRSMLLSPGLAGLRQYQGEVVAKGQWDAIIPPEQHEQVRALLNENHKPKAGRPVTFLFSTLAACGRCGAPLWGHRRSQKRGGGTEYACMKNPGRPGCGRLTVAAGPLEELVVEMVLQRLAGPGLTKMLAAQENTGPTVGAELNALDAQVRELEEAWRSQQVKMDSFLRMYGPLENRREGLRAQLAQQSSTSVLWSLPRTETALRSWWDEAALDQRRSVLSAVLHRVVVGPAPRASRTFDPARLDPSKGWGPIWKV